MKNFKVKKAIQNKVDYINSVLTEIDNLDEYPHAYDGGTFPFYIALDKAIEIKNQFLYIGTKNTSNNIDVDKRYNLNNEQSFDEAKHILNLIAKTYKKELKNN